MKYLSIVRHPESYRQSAPPAALTDKMSEFAQKSVQAGTIVSLLPSKDGARVRLANGKLTVTDGPFTESKEVVGGWGVLKADTKAEAIRIVTEFMELHRRHWPEFECECEVRAMLEPAEGP